MITPHLALLARYPSRDYGKAILYLLYFKLAVMVLLLLFMAGDLYYRFTGRVGYEAARNGTTLERTLTRRQCQWNPWCYTDLWDIHHK